MLNTITTLTKDLKIRAKKLFKIAFKSTKSFISLRDVKKKFPLFDGRKAVHWFNLIDKLEVLCQAIDKAEKAKQVTTMSLQEFNAYCHELIEDACKKYDCSIQSTDWLGYSSKLSSKDHNGVMRIIGTLYINRQGVASISSTSWGRNVRKVVVNINQGFQILLSMFRKEAIAA